MFAAESSLAGFDPETVLSLVTEAEGRQWRRGDVAVELADLGSRLLG